MKIKKVIALCKEAGQFCIYEGKQQWLGEGGAIYPLHGAPEFDDETICKAYDIPPKKAAEYIFRHEDFPAEFTEDDQNEHEIPIERKLLSFEWRNEQYTAYEASTGAVVLNRRYLDPFDDPDGVMLFERRTDKGQMYFAVKAGMLLVGIIMPVAFLTADFEAAVSRFLTEIRRARANGTRGGGS